MASGQSQNELGGRQYFLDWVRVLAFALLIFYHTGMMFVEWDFHIESGFDSELLKSIMMLSSNWRLDVLFMVSGVAISFMVYKMPLNTFSRQRMVKLFAPLLFAVAVVVAPQAYYEAIQKGLYEGNFWQFWTSQYFTFTWDERMLAPFPTYNHMWYVLYLIAYTYLLLPLFSFINGENGRALLARVEDWLNKGSRIIWVPLGLYFSILLVFRSDEITHAFYNDWYGHSIYLLALVMGLLFVRMPSVWLAFERNRGKSLVLALIGYGLLLANYHFPDLRLPGSGAIISLFVKWTWLAMILGYAKRYLDFTNPALAYCNEAVYPFFILHQTVIIALGFYVIDWGLPGVGEFFVIASGTFLVCGLLCELVIKKVSFLRLMFGLKVQSRAVLHHETSRA